MTDPVVTLDRDGPDLQQVRARRRQLQRLLLVIVVVLAAGVVLFSIASEQFLDRPLDVLDVSLVRIGFVALSLVFAGYIFLRERTLSRAERSLVEGRVLAAALSNRLHELSALNEAGKAVTSELSQERIFDIILVSARDLLDATEASVMLVDPETKLLRVVASTGLDPAVVDEAVTVVGEGVAGWVAKSLEPIILRGDARDRRFRRVVPKERRVSSAMSAPLRSGDDVLGVVNVSVSRNGRTYSEHDLQALTTFAEQAGSAIANARLFEHERRTSAELAELERQRRDFLATLTHDLKTPLTSILGYVKLLRRAGEGITPEQTDTFTDVIERQGRRILEMVEQLLEATRLEEGAPALVREPLDLARLINEQVLAMGGVAGGRRFDVSMPTDFPDTYGDRQAVEHILMNLLENAVKYTPDPSTIVVRVEPAPGEVRVSVTDDGPGIPEAELPQVFERYRRSASESKKGSVGLGLYIVRSLAQAHGGRVWAENVPDKGVRITFTLPVRSKR